MRVYPGQFLARPHKPTLGVQLPHPLPCVQGVGDCTLGFQPSGQGLTPCGRSMGGPHPSRQFDLCGGQHE